LLFLNAGAIEYSLGTRNLKEMGGLSRSMPFTSATSFVASMAISGIPPFNGFFSKLVIIIACVKAGFYLLAILAVVVSILTLASFLKLQRYAFYGKESGKAVQQVREVSGTMIFSMMTLGILCILLSLLIFPSMRESILQPAVDILMNPDTYVAKIIGM